MTKTEKRTEITSMPEKRRLCLISHGLAAYGVDVMVVNIILALDKNKWDISLIIAVDDGTTQFNEQTVRALGVPIYRTNDLRTSKDIITHYKKLREILSRIKPDIVHSHMGFFDSINLRAAKSAGVAKRISHAHNKHANADIGKGRCSFSVICHNIFRDVLRCWLSSIVTDYCGCSEEAITYHFGNKVLKSGKSTVVNNAIDLHRFRHDNRTECLKELGIQDSCYRIVTIGMLTMVKNPFFIVDIMSEICKMRNDVELIWVGQGSLEKDIREKIQGGGHIGSYSDAWYAKRCG